MDQELRGYLDAFESRFTARVTDVESRLIAHVTNGESQFKSHVSEEIEKLETKILTEFWKWGRTADMRTRQALTDVSVLGERLLAVEDRITALERKRAS